MLQKYENLLYFSLFMHFISTKSTIITKKMHGFIKNV